MGTELGRIQSFVDVRRKNVMQRSNFYNLKLVNPICHELPKARWVKMHGISLVQYTTTLAKDSR
jgi:hypothetical protein